jgi:hypothetical protein
MDLNFGDFSFVQGSVSAQFTKDNLCILCRDCLTGKTTEK